MPLLKGKSNIGNNIKELEDSEKVRPRKQILAIALNAAGESRKPGAKLKKFKGKMV